MISLRRCRGGSRVFQKEEGGGSCWYLGIADSVRHAPQMLQFKNWPPSHLATQFIPLSHTECIPDMITRI